MLNGVETRYKCNFICGGQKIDTALVKGTDDNSQ